MYSKSLVFRDKFLDMVSPEIYELNPFNLLGISTIPNSKEIQRNIQKVKTIIELGGEVKNLVIIPIVSEVDEFAIKDAIEKMYDQIERFIYELFWFWSDEKLDTEALVAIKKRDFKKAVEMWNTIYTETGSVISLHNLAILHHALALYRERSSFIISESENYWKKAFYYWKILLENETFWTYIANKIDQINDPRIDKQIEQELRSLIPEALIRINASLAYEYVSNGNMDIAKYHIKLAKDFSLNTAEKIFKKIINPVSLTIKNMCKDTIDETRKSPSNGALFSDRLLNWAKEMLSIVDVFFEKGQSIREVLHDEVAETILNCQIQYAESTKDWEKSVILLEKALKIAEGAKTRKRLEENLRISKDNLEYVKLYTVCYFCGKNSPDESAKVEVKMHRVIEKTFLYIRWRSVNVEVPRCERCRKIHGQKDTILAISSILLIIGIIALIAGKTVGGIFGLFSSFSGFFIRWRIVNRAKVKDIDEAKDFPLVKKLLNEGWKLGEKPENA